MIEKVDTKKVSGRRKLEFRRMEDLLEDVERLGAGDIEVIGNWMPAQIVQHVTRIITCSLDGFDFKAPFPLGIVGRFFKHRFMTRTFSPGINLRPKMKQIMPDPDVSWAQATGELRREILRISGGRRMTVPSPLFGPLSHADWVKLHCRHAELHFSFMREAAPMEGGEGLRKL